MMKKFKSILELLKEVKERINTVKILTWVSKKDSNKFRRLVKERYRLERELPYIDVETMIMRKKLRLIKY